MKRIAVISSDKVLERAVVLALRCSAAGARHGGRGNTVELVAMDGSALDDGRADGCDMIVVVGAAEFISGRLSAAALRRCAGQGRQRERAECCLHTPEILVISWQHCEQTVMGLLECGVDQYMTMPLSLRRLCLKIVNR